MGNAEQATFDEYKHLEFPNVWGMIHANPVYQDADRRSTDAVRRSRVLFQKIAQARAVTLKGVMAKARIVLGESLEGIDKELEERTDGIVPGFMGVSLVRDLLEQGGELRLPVNGGEA